MKKAIPKTVGGKRAGAGWIVASAKTVPPAATPAAWDRKLRRVEAAGIAVVFSEST